jgi:hypothetical protein
MLPGLLGRRLHLGLSSVARAWMVDDGAVYAGELLHQPPG